MVNIAILAGSAKDQILRGLEGKLSSSGVAAWGEDHDEGRVGRPAMLLLVLYLSCGHTELSTSGSLKAKNSLCPNKPMGKDIVS